MRRTIENVCEVRRQFVRPLFEKWKSEGRTLVFLASRLNTSSRRLAAWRDGYRGIPEVYLAGICRETGIPRELLGNRPYPYSERPRRRSA